VGTTEARECSIDAKAKILPVREGAAFDAEVCLSCAAFVLLACQRRPILELGIWW